MLRRSGARRWRRRTPSSSRPAPSCSVATTSRSRGSSARISGTSRTGETSARSPLRGVDRLEPRVAWPDRPGDGLAGPRTAAPRERGRVCRARLSAPAGDVPARGGRRLRRGGCGRGRGRSHRRALRRPGPVRARDPRTGLHADQGRTGARGPRPARRGDGRRHRRGALADRDRDGLLRRHPRLPGGVRGASRARVDESALGLVGAAAGDGRVHRSLPRAPGGDPPAGRLLARCAGRGAARRGALRRDEESGGRPRSLPPGRAPPAAGRVRRRGGGVQGGERVRLGAAARARAAAPRAGTRRGGCGGDPPGGGGDLAAARARAAASGLRRDHARGGRGRERATCVSPSSRSSREATRARCWRRWSPTRRARSTSRRATRRRRSSRCGARARRWQALEAPYEIARTRVLVGEACRAARRRRGGGAGARGGAEHLRAPRREAGSRAARRPRDATRTACRGGSSRCSGSSLRGRATARSPPRS